MLNYITLIRFTVCTFAHLSNKVHVRALSSRSLARTWSSWHLKNATLISILVLVLLLSQNLLWSIMFEWNNCS